MKYTVKFKGYVLIKYVDGQIHLQLQCNTILSVYRERASKDFFFKIQPNKSADPFFFYWNGIHNCKY